MLTCHTLYFYFTTFVGFFSFIVFLSQIINFIHIITLIRQYLKTTTDTLDSTLVSSYGTGLVACLSLLIACPLTVLAALNILCWSTAIPLAFVN